MSSLWIFLSKSTSDSNCALSGFFIPPPGSSPQRVEANARIPCRFLTRTVVGTLVDFTSEAFWIVVIRATDHPI